MSTGVFAFPARNMHNTFYCDNIENFEVISTAEIHESKVISLGVLYISGRPYFHYLSQDISVFNVDARMQDMLHRRESANRVHTRIMAVINTTPDSFYPGSRHILPDSDLDIIIDQKPDIIDIGGESTRPGSLPVSASEEIERIRPVLDYVTSVSRIPVSLDTRHPEVANYFREKISILNDIGGFSDRKMVSIAAESDLQCVVMHMRGTPETMQNMTHYEDIVAETVKELQDRAINLMDSGVVGHRIIVDPGIGFAKDAAGNLEILRNIRSYRFGFPLLVGVSRKAFIGHITGRDVNGRLPGTIALTAYFASEGVDIVRVHDVAENRDAVKIIEALKNPGS
ncbi:MAG: dihydropteroate synthase [Thermoplasmataceae archaeon]